MNYSIYSDSIFLTPPAKISLLPTRISHQIYQTEAEIVGAG